MTTTVDEPRYDWHERRFYTKGAPEGMCWSVRRMCSWGFELERFIPHLQAMAAGLERARYSEYDRDPHSLFDDDDNNGPFVIGLRPLTAEDRTQAQRDAEQAELDERALLAELLAKYPDAAAT